MVFRSQIFILEEFNFEFF